MQQFGTTLDDIGTAIANADGPLVFVVIPLIVIALMAYPVYVARKAQAKKSKQPKSTDKG